MYRAWGRRHKYEEQGLFLNVFLNVQNQSRLAWLVARATIILVLLDPSPIPVLFDRLDARPRSSCTVRMMFMVMVTVMIDDALLVL
jgi:hypothetical protein